VYKNKGRAFAFYLYGKVLLCTRYQATE
jgi:hypothetical protein